MGIRSILAGIFGSNDEQGRDSSPGQIARDRLTVIVMGDRTGISPAILENMKQEIIEVIKRYAEIDETQINLALENEGDSMALVANIPIHNVSRNPTKDVPKERRRA